MIDYEEWIGGVLFFLSHCKVSKWMHSRSGLVWSHVFELQFTL